jgi:hypothetical protein
MHELKFQQLKISMQVICCFVISNRLPNKRKCICRCHPTFLRLGCDKMLAMCDDLHKVVKCTTFIIVRNFKYATIQKYLKPLVFEKPKSFIQNKSSSPNNIFTFLFGSSNFLLYFTTLSSKNQLSLCVFYFLLALTFYSFYPLFWSIYVTHFLKLSNHNLFPKVFISFFITISCFFQPSNVYFKPPKA